MKESNGFFLLSGNIFDYTRTHISRHAGKEKVDKGERGADL